MNELKQRIHDETSGLDYVLAGNYYIPAIELSESDDRPVGKWGRMHRTYLEEANPFLLSHLILTDKLHTYLANLTNRHRGRYRLIIKHMAVAESVAEDLRFKATAAVGVDQGHE